MMYLATIAVLLCVWLWFWARFRDPFHPAIILLPLFMFLYGYMPWELQNEDPQRFARYAGGDAVYRYQAITLGLIAALVGGILWATRGLTRQTARWRMLKLANPGGVLLMALVLGLAGFAAWMTLILSAGGFQEAYGTAKGGGHVRSGYIREMRYLGLVGALLVYMTRSGKGMRPRDWLIVLICIAPTLTHAVLGARRGPLFLAVIVLAGGYIYFMRKRLSLTLLVASGAALGGAMLFLVANRGEIYLGTDLGLNTFRDPTEFLVRWASNEYLIGGAVVRYTDLYGSFYGRREIAWLIARFLPAPVWPTVWTDLPQILGISVNLRINGGVSQEGLTTISTWTPSVGSAEGFTGSLYLEFRELAPVAAFAIGFAYGKVWSAAKTSLSARVFYLLMVATSVYLVMQSLDPWLYRLLLFGLPAYLILRMVRARPVDAVIKEGGALAPSGRKSQRRGRWSGMPAPYRRPE